MTDTLKDRDPNKDAPAFDFYPERWLVGVALLSDAEQLTYMRLLCHQWMLQGLPSDPADLKRLGGKGVTAKVLEKLPLCADGKRRNPRLEVIRAEQRERIRKSREKIAKMNESRLNKRASLPPSPSPAPLQEALHDPLQDERQEGSQEADKKALTCVLTSSSPLTTHPTPPVLLKKEPKARAVSKSPGFTYSEDFLQLWNAYPRKDGKGAAYTAWHRLAGRPDVSTILAALAVHRRSSQWLRDDGSFIPFLSTWLHQRRWEDEPACRSTTREPEVTGLQMGWGREFQQAPTNQDNLDMEAF